MMDVVEEEMMHMVEIMLIILKYPHDRIQIDLHASIDGEDGSQKKTDTVVVIDGPSGAEE